MAHVGIAWKRVYKLPEQGAKKKIQRNQYPTTNPLTHLVRYKRSHSTEPPTYDTVNYIYLLRTVLRQGPIDHRTSPDPLHSGEPKI